MKTTIKIAKTELGYLFYSPIAWFLLIVFLIQCGLTYTGAIGTYIVSQNLGGEYLKSLGSLTAKVLGAPYGVLANITKQTYLYFPLLTMGLMSREINSGTIKLLYSSPVTISEIVLGKYLAMMVYSLLLVAVVSIFVVAGVFNIQSTDTGMLLSGLLGIYLLLCTYSAIGLFMSSLTSYQVVAAIATLVMLGVLGYIGNLWQDIEFVRDLTYWLSISGRTEKMLGGLITSKDFLYFALIVYLFLGLTILKLRAGRESVSAGIRAGRYALVVVSALAFGYISSRTGLIGYYDATADKSRTLTPNAQKIVKELGDEPLEVTTYINLLDGLSMLGSPSQRNTNLGRWESYMRFKPNIHLNYVYYYDSAFDNPYLYKSHPEISLKERAEKYAKATQSDITLFKTPEEIHKLIDLRPENNRYVMQLKYKDRTTFLRVFDDPALFPGETEVSAAFERLMLAKLPRIAFVEGDFERSIDKTGDKDYKTLTNLPTFRYALVNQGFDVEKVSLHNGEIPTDIAALVIADPKVSLDTAEMMKLQRYIEGGGNLMICGEPGKQSILNPLLRPLGVQLNEGQVVQKSRDFDPGLVLPNMTYTAVSFYKPLVRSQEDSLPVSMQGVAGLTYETSGPFAIKPLLVTDARVSWNKNKRLDPDAAPEMSKPDKPKAGGVSAAPAGASAAPAGASVTGAASPAAPAASLATSAASPAASAAAPAAVSGNAATMAGGTKGPKIHKPVDLATDPLFSAADGDRLGSVSTALSLTRHINGKEQRIVVTGDADFLSNAELSRNNVRTTNFTFTTGLFSWLSNGEFPIETSRPKSKDNLFDLTDKGLKELKMLLLGILPGILLLFGIVLLIRRKRQ